MSSLETPSNTLSYLQTSQARFFTCEKIIWLFYDSEEDFDQEIKNCSSDNNHLKDVLWPVGHQHHLLSIREQQNIKHVGAPDSPSQSQCCFVVPMPSSVFPVGPQWKLGDSLLSSGSPRLLQVQLSVSKTFPSFPSFPSFPPPSLSGSPPSLGAGGEAVAVQDPGPGNHAEISESITSQPCPACSHGHRN